MSATSEESIESQLESLALADDACYDETKEQATFTPMMFQRGNDGEIAIAVSHDPEERVVTKNLPELFELLLKKIEALPEKPRIDIVWDVTLWQHCTGLNIVVAGTQRLSIKHWFGPRGSMH